MVDVAVVALLVLLAVRGWFRGLVRELLGLAVLLLGFVVSIRAAPAVGTFIAELTGLAPAWSRLVGGFTVFVGIAIGAAVVSRLAHRSLRALPGMSTLNRLAGSAFGVSAGLVVVVVVITLVAIVGLPAAAEDEFAKSVAVEQITDPDGPVQEVITTLTDTNDLSALLTLRELADRTAIGPESSSVALPPVDHHGLELQPDAAGEVYDLLNRSRVTEKIDPVSWSDALAAVAADVAFEMYSSGDLRTATPVDARLDDAGLTYVVAVHHVALAVEPSDVHHSLARRPDVADERTDERYRRVGIGVVSGPYGLLTVEVLTG